MIISNLGLIQGQFKLAAPTDLLITNPLTPEGIEYVDRLKIDFTSQSNGLETGFEIEFSLDNITYILLPPLATGVTTYTHTGLPYNTLYYYRVRATGSVNSPWSIVASGTVAINALIVSGFAGFIPESRLFNNNLNDSSTRVTGWADIYGNGRDISTPFYSNQPYMSNKSFNNRGGVMYYKYSGDKKYLDNITSWLIGLQDYTVIIASFAKTQTSGFSLEFNSNEPLDSGIFTSAHQLSRNGLATRDFMRPSRSGGSCQLTDSVTLREGLSVDMYHVSISGSSEGMWYNGVLNPNADYNTGTLTEPFDTVRFGNVRDLNVQSNNCHQFEILFLVGSPSSQAQQINDLHEFYLNPKYGGVSNPNIV